MDSKIKIVIADDMEMFVNNIKKIAEKNPRVEKIETASDGQEEIIKIMNFEPDLVFTDMQMPKRDGLDVIESIQSYPAVRKKPRFVLVTSDRDSRLVVKSRKLGFLMKRQRESKRRKILKHLEKKWEKSFFKEIFKEK